MKVEKEGSVVIFTPDNEDEATWMKANVVAESWQWIGWSLAVDQHFADELFDAARGQGFV
jgi:hypothetical protein